MTRSDEAVRICERITAQINELSPMGLGRWPATWKIAEDASAEFLAALTRWEHQEEELHPDTAERLRRRVAEKEKALMESWKAAIRAYVAAGHPTRETDHAS